MIINVKYVHVQLALKKNALLFFIVKILTVNYHLICIAAKNLIVQVLLIISVKIEKYNYHNLIETSKWKIALYCVCYAFIFVGLLYIIKFIHIYYILNRRQRPIAERERVYFIRVR